MIVAEVRVKLKKGVADPEGANTRKALELLGFSEVTKIQTSKCFSISLDSNDLAQARERVEQMCQGLLANPVIQSYDITLSRED
jgi:phosphoribosylformylglycinamidine synthase PurS subunit